MVVETETTVAVKAVEREARVNSVSAMVESTDVRMR